jgi:hypothetical protein
MEISSESTILLSIGWHAMGLTNSMSERRDVD